MGLSNRQRRPNSLIRLSRRHSDVGKHDVGGVFGDRGEQFVGVLTRGDELVVGGFIEQRSDALAHEKTVFGENEGERYGSEITRARPSTRR